MFNHPVHPQIEEKVNGMEFNSNMINDEYYYIYNVSKYSRSECI
jgi:hypothetical protein